MPGNRSGRLSRSAAVTCTTLAEPEIVPISVIRPAQPQPATVETSAVTGEGIDDLVEKVGLEAELLELTFAAARSGRRAATRQRPATAW